MKEINKEEFKKEIEDYVKVLFRKTIKEAVADFQKGNMRLGLALTLVKEEMK